MIGRLICILFHWATWQEQWSFTGRCVTCLRCGRTYFFEE